MRRARCGAQWFLAFALAAAAPLGAVAQTARIAIIIDDLGYNRGAGLRAVALPGPVAVAILPHTAHGGMLAAEAHARGKEVLLHLPMQAESTAAAPGDLMLGHTPAELTAALDAGLAAVPHVQGVSNHQGSRLTRDAGAMRSLMAALAPRELFFIDSYTTHRSVALREARIHAVPALRRHVFLDGDPAPAAIEREWRRLLALARDQGFAIAIGHPHDATLDWLEQSLAAVEAADVQLVTLASLLAVDDGQLKGSGQPSRDEP